MSSVHVESQNSTSLVVLVSCPHPCGCPASMSWLVLYMVWIILFPFPEAHVPFFLVCPTWARFCRASVPSLGLVYHRVCHSCLTSGSPFVSAGLSSSVFMITVIIRVLRSCLSPTSGLHRSAKSRTTYVSGSSEPREAFVMPIACELCCKGDTGNK